MTHRIFHILFCISNFAYTYAYQLCVVGATSGLGRELVYQAALDKNMSVLALSGSSSPLTIPCRSNSFQESESLPPFQNPNVVRDNYWNDLSSYDYEKVVFTTGASPFKEDYSDKLMSKILTDLPPSCKNLVLISAYGVGDSLKPDEFGINAMNSWYLKDVYRAKNAQEEMLGLNMFKKKYPNLKINIMRPRALSYGETFLKSVSRKQFAQYVLETPVADLF